jgi:hypothetical protein
LSTLPQRIARKRPRLPLAAPRGNRLKHRTTHDRLRDLMVGDRRTLDLLPADHQRRRVSLARVYWSETISPEGDV